MERKKNRLGGPEKMGALQDLARSKNFSISRAQPGNRLLILSRATGKTLASFEFVEDLEEALLAMEPEYIPTKEPKEVVEWRVAAQDVPASPKRCPNVVSDCLCLKEDEWLFCVVGAPNPEAEGWSGCFRRASCWGACTGHGSAIKLFGDMQKNARAKTDYIIAEGKFDELRDVGEKAPLYRLKMPRPTGGSNTTLSKEDLALISAAGIIGLSVRAIGANQDVFVVTDKDGHVLAADLNKTDLLRDFFLLDL